jgi:starch-binding outer membrane protein, SusD/RagB family
MKKYSPVFILLVVCISLSGCQKYLEIIPKDKFVPSSVEDFRLLLNDQFSMNNSTGLGDISSDDVSFSDAQFNNLASNYLRNAYAWKANLYDAGELAASWSSPYLAINYANTIIDGLQKNQTGLQSDRDQVTGEALFFRAYSYFNLVSLFAKQYVRETAGSDPGVPLRMSPGPYQTVNRASVEDVYRQIIKDLESAIPLLSTTTDYKTRPSKIAAYGLLSRIYLQTGQYSQALGNATLALNSVDTLLNYNSLNPALPALRVVFPVTVTSNPEVIFLSFSTDLAGPGYFISADQFNSYAANDLRRDFFFRYDNSSARYQFIGNYHDGGRTSAPQPFSGISTAELYLIRAECYARSNSIANALADLNKLLKRRIKTDSFVPITSTSAPGILSLVLSERRKELIFRNLRWNDLKRLNKETAFAVTLVRNVSGKTYTLPPSSNNYVMPLPDQEIELAGLGQNPRD